MSSPRGAIVRRCRLSETETLPDGSTSKMTLTGAGILVRVRPNAESRRSFHRFCVRNGLVTTACECNAHADGTFNRRTGERMREGEAAPTAFQVIGNGPALLALTQHPCVADWEYALSVRVPYLAGGSGELSEAGKRGLREARREGFERAAACERAQRREHEPDAEAAELRAVAEHLGIPREDMPALAELVRLSRRESSLTDSERSRVSALRNRLGL